MKTKGKRKGHKQDPTKFRATYPNVDYTDFILNVRNKRLYRMSCKACGQNRGYKIHNEAIRSCLKCHAKKYTKKSKEQRRVYNSMKANVNQRFRWRKVNKDAGVFRYLPYTLDQLMKHLESQFEPWMNWENHGLYNPNRKTWQIDHVKPDSKFSYSNPTDKGFLDSWALSNLQPLESMANILKSDKWFE